MSFTIVCSYKSDRRERLVAKEAALQKVWAKACQIARELEEKQTYGISIQIEPRPTEDCWVATLDIHFPISCYYEVDADGQA